MVIQQVERRPVSNAIFIVQGDSEYKIDGKKVRLRDVHVICSWMGLGRIDYLQGR